MRFLPHPANFAPIAAVALFSGVYLDKKYALIAPLAAMMISDAFLGFHELIPLTWGSFFVAGMIGWFVRTHKNVATVAGGALVSSLFFFLVTNWGVWQFNGYYEHTAAGLLLCFTNALPFFRNTLLGDLFYTGLLFGVYESIAYAVRSQTIIDLYNHGNTKE